MPCYVSFAREKADIIRPTLLEEYEKSLPLDFVKAAKSLSLEIEQTPLFNRGQYLPKIGISKTFQEAAFSLTEEDPISDVVNTQNGFCIIHLDKYEEANSEDYEIQKDDIAGILLNSKRLDMFGDFTSRLRIESNLIDNVTKLKQEQS